MANFATVIALVCQSGTASSRGLFSRPRRDVSNARALARSHAAESSQSQSQQQQCGWLWYGQRHHPVVEARIDFIIVACEIRVEQAKRDGSSRRRKIRVLRIVRAESVSRDGRHSETARRQPAVRLRGPASNIGDVQLPYVILPARFCFCPPTVAFPSCTVAGCSVSRSRFQTPWLSLRKPSARDWRPPYNRRQPRPLTRGLPASACPARWRRAPRAAMWPQWCSHSGRY